MKRKTVADVELVGGHVALDFVNTVGRRPDPPRSRDYVPDFQALLTWARRAGAIDETHATAMTRVADEEPAATRRAVDETRQLREILYAVLAAVSASEPPAEQDLASFQGVLLEALCHATPRRSLPLRWHLEPREPADVPRLLAIAAMELLQSADLDSLRRCQNDVCGWIFLDRSRSHTRRWCSSSNCGNRERVRRHASRHRTT